MGIYASYNHFYKTNIENEIKLPKNEGININDGPKETKDININENVNFIEENKEKKEENNKKEENIEKEEKNEKEENIEKEEEKEKLIVITKYSSLDPDLFLNENKIDYKCIKCGLIPSFEKAYETICCGNLICEECLKKLNEDKKGCSICNIEELKTRDIKKENKIFYKSFKSLLIKCPYKCDWKGMWVDLESHLYECKLSYRECKYKFIGCEFIDENNRVKEHENSNNKYHLFLALEFIKDKKIVKKKIKFELGEKCKAICHPHIMTYMKSMNWSCDGRKLDSGCYSRYCHFTSNVARFRCAECDFDLCDKCIVHYIE